MTVCAHTEENNILQFTVSYWSDYHRVVEHNELIAPAAVRRCRSP